MENFVDLTPDQLAIAAPLNNSIIEFREKAQNAQEKLDLFISGILTTKGMTGRINYTIKDNQIVANIPDEPTPETPIA
jgi:hypothetical protein